MLNDRTASAQTITDALETLRHELFARAERLLSVNGETHPGDLAAAAERLAAAAGPVFAEEERRLGAARSLTLERHAREHARFLADLGILAAVAVRNVGMEVAALRPSSWLPAWLAAHGRTDRDVPAERPGRRTVA